MTSSRRMVSLIFMVVAAFSPAAAVGQAACAAQAKTVLYAAVGPELDQYDLDLNAATLTKRSSIVVPDNVQEVAIFKKAPSQEYLYAAWSNGGPTPARVDTPGHHGVSAFSIDPASGALLPHGAPIELPSRPIFITADRSGTHIVTAHNDPSSLNVYKIMPDGTLGARVPQPANLDFGIYGHQVRADPSGKTIFLMARGNAPTATKPEDRGAIKIFSYKDGVLGNLLSIAPGNGLNYQVRHLDFAPSGKWVYTTLEKQNQLHVYRRLPDGTLSPEPLFVRSTLAKMTPEGAGQAASIHVHPNGMFVYLANRTIDEHGENSIAVFSINQHTGEPTLIQSIPTQGFEPRTFALDSCGKILAVGNQRAGTIRDSGGTATTVPASIVLFRILGDGQLQFARKYDIETTRTQSLFWVGIASLP